MLRIQKVSKGELVLFPESQDHFSLVVAEICRTAVQIGGATGGLVLQDLRVSDLEGPFLLPERELARIDFTPHSPPCRPTSFRPRSGIMGNTISRQLPFQRIHFSSQTLLFEK